MRTGTDLRIKLPRAWGGAALLAKRKRVCVSVCCYCRHLVLHKILGHQFAFARYLAVFSFLVAMEWQWPWYLLALGLAIALVLEGCISQDEIRKQEAQRGSEMCREAHERNACNVTPSCLLNTCVRPFSCRYDTLSDGITGGGYIEMCRCQWVGSNISESRSCIANAVKNYTDTTWFCEDLRYYNELDRRWERDDENCSCEVCNDTLFEGGRLFTHSGYAQTARIVTGEDDDWSFGPKASPDLGKVSAEVKNKVEWHYKLQGLAEHASVPETQLFHLFFWGGP